MNIAITGPDGFVAWHTRCAARARWGGDLIGVRREHFDDPNMMAESLAKAEAVIHLAGVNRASDEQVIRETNPWLAERLVEALERLDTAVPVIYGNSIQADGDSVFGQAKREARDVLTNYGKRSGAVVADVVLPNIFGEWGRPFYNSFVATFCHQLARGETPQIEVDRVVPLLHVQKVATVLLDLAQSTEGGRVDPPATPLTVSEVLSRLRSMSEGYRNADLPDLSEPFSRDLFNTYRSYTFPEQWPVFPPAHSDERGSLYESVKAAGGEAQVFFSTTRPGMTRGEHFHLRKVERFLVLSGSGMIRMRKIFGDQILEFPVSGESPGIVDMPTMWAHSITNTGDKDLITLFYADEILDPEQPDTYAERV